jgi:hypothetical protein
VNEESKDEVAFDFFNNILGVSPVRANAINLHNLNLPRLSLASLCERFIEEDVWAVIRSLLPDKASGSDSFSARFLQLAWPIIRLDIMAAFDAFWHLNMRNTHNVNGALLTLLPKSTEADTLKDY